MRGRPSYSVLTAAWTDNTNRQLVCALLTCLLAIMGSYAITDEWLTTSPHKRLLPSGYVRRITYLRITGARIDNTLSKDPFGEGWRVNNSYAADPYARQTLWHSLVKARTQRVLEAEERREIAIKMRDEGYRVVVKGKGLERSFEVCGDSISGLSYVRFPNNDSIYVLTVPGYANYVAGIFGLTALQWKNRLLFDYPRGTLQRLTLRYQARKTHGWDMRLNQGAISLLDVPRSETNRQRLQAYVNHFASFYVNEYIQRGQLALYDSILTHHKPFAVLEIASTHLPRRRVNVYANEEEPFYLLKDGENLSLCEKKRFGAFLRDRKYFAKRGNNLAGRR